VRIIEKYLNAEGENMQFADFEQLMVQGESRIIERKSIRDFQDYKRNADKIKKYILKTVSAFSNHGGGIVLIGVDDKGNIEEGVLSEVSKQSTRERLIDVIESNITPALRDFAVKIIERNGKHLFAVIVGDSSNAPHQANDNKYYGRIDGRSLPLDGMQVRDIITRVREVDLEPTAEAVDRKLPNATSLIIGVKNLSKICADDVLVFGDFICDGSIRGNVNSSNSSTLEIPGGGRKFQFGVDIVYPDVPHVWAELPREVGIWGVCSNIKINISTVARNSKRSNAMIQLKRQGSSFVKSVDC